MKNRSIVDNADYVPQQISFLDASGCISSDCVCRSDDKCRVCERRLPKLDEAKTLYWVACGEPIRICFYCYRRYKKNWSFHLSKSVVCKNKNKVSK